MSRGPRWASHKALTYAGAPSAPPPAEEHADRVIYGLVQPLLGARVLFSDWALLRAVLWPAGLLALFCALVLNPGQTVADLDAAAEKLPRVWFVRLLQNAAERLPVGRWPVRRFARFCDRLSLPWREEVLLIEHHPSLVVGFALATAGLL